jgi:GNAT superfamily N-acetyltransferase
VSETGAVTVRPARREDAVGIGRVHVAAWRSAYATILPAAYLAGLSLVRQAAGYDRAIAAGACVMVAEAEGRVVGFATAAVTPGAELGEGEIQTLYVQDDWRDHGAGRALLRAVGLFLAGQGCTTAYLWVLRDNPSRWFYERLGGRPAARGTVPVAGQDVPQTAYVWDPIEALTRE